MKQKGTVIDIQGEYATVEVMRTSACVGCSQQEGCIACKKKIQSRAYNPMGAKKGDTVTLESPSGTVLFYALLVFVLPLALAIAGYLAAALFTDVQIIQISVSACIFILMYVIIYFIFDRNPNAKNTVRITEIDPSER